MKSQEEKFLDLLKFASDREDVTVDTVLTEVLNSLDLVEFSLLIEEEFNLKDQISSEELSKFKTGKDVLEYLSKNS